MVVNSYAEAFRGLKARARVYNLDLALKFAREAAVEAAPDSSSRVFTIPQIQGLTTTYFVRLELTDSAARQVSTNFYWLSTKPETLDWDKSEWYYTPVKTHADLRGLETLPAVKLKVSGRPEPKGDEQTMHVTVENHSKLLAFAARLKITMGKGGEEVLPVWWEDNYFSLLPGEKREIKATYRVKDLGKAEAAVEASCGF